jgi:hypothetical protein
MDLARYSVRAGTGLGTRLIKVLLVIQLAGCGGGASVDPDAVGATAPKRSISAQAVVQPITPDQLMNWAEQAFVDLFPGHAQTLVAPGFVYRHYPTANSFIAVKSDGGVYVLFLNSSDQVKYIAPIADFTCLVTPTAATCLPPIYTVVFTHIEDTTPTGTLGTAQSRANYLVWRDLLIKMANLTRRYNMTWVLQPDWKFLEAALLYEDTATMASTGGVNLLRYLRDNLGVIIDPHSHEGGGYNYPDVAYLLEQLGVGGSTVIGGHVWDPSLPQFAHWERFRVPVAGEKYPSALWRGELLMGSGTPGHTNDPIISGMWRPKDPYNYFVDDPLGNISAVGAYKSDVAGITTLRGLYETGRFDATCMLTNTIHVFPSTISSAGGLATIERDVVIPLQTLRDSGQVEITNFTALAATWKSRFAGKACIYQE